MTSSVLAYANMNLLATPRPSSSRAGLNERKRLLAKHAATWKSPAQNRSAAIMLAEPAIFCNGVNLHRMLYTHQTPPSGMV